MSGMGRTYFNNYFETESRSYTHKNEENFHSYNYGFGLGAQFLSFKNQFFHFERLVQMSFLVSYDYIKCRI